MESKDHDNLELKLTDFGMSTFFETGKKENLSLGSPFYMAPEVLFKLKYNEKADIYSIGVIAYNLLSGDHPYDASSIEEL